MFIGTGKIRGVNIVFDCRSHYSSLADGVPQPGSRDPAAGVRRNPPVRYTTQTFSSVFYFHPLLPFYLIFMTISTFHFTFLYYFSFVF